MPDFHPSGPRAVVRAQRWAAHTLVSAPRKSLALLFALLFALAFPGMMMMSFSDEGDYDWSVADNVDSERYDAMQAAEALLAASVAADEEPEPRSESSQDVWLQVFYYARSGATVFTPARLQEMCEIEQIMLREARYDEVCVLDDGACKDQTQSIVTRFYNQTDPPCDEPLAQSAVDAGVAALLADLEDLELRGEAGFFVPPGFEASGDAAYTRSMLNVGVPLEGFDAGMDDFEQYQEDGFFDAVEADLFDEFNVERSWGDSPYASEYQRYGDLNVQWFNFIMFDTEITTVIAEDSAFALGSILFVLAYSWFHTKSLTLAACGVLQTTLSLPIAFLLYKGVFGLDYFTALHSLVIFLLLGVGADDQFVFVDAFKLARTRFADLETQLLFAYSFASGAVFNTSLTTFIAFVATAGSEIMPISSFGVYASLCVALQFFYVITLTPAVVVNLDLGCCGCCGFWRKEKVLSAGEVNVELAELPPKEPKEPKINEPEPKPPSGAVKSRLIDGVIAARWAIVAAFAAWIACAAASAAALSTPTELELWFPDDHMFSSVMTQAAEGFLTFSDDDYVDAAVVFGVAGVDRSDFSRWSPNENRGQPVFVSGWNLSSPATQSDVLAACEVIREYPCSASGCGGGFGLLALPDSVSCPLEDMLAWLGADELPAGAAFDAALADFLAEREDLAWELGVVDGSPLWARISFKTTLGVLANYRTSKPVRDVAEEMAASLSGAPFQYAEAWTWLRFEAALVAGLMQGMAICLPAAFGVLLVSTANWVLALCACLSIGGIVVSVLGSIQLMGWALGVPESISGVIVIGLAVDYCVHVAHVYAEATEIEARADKVRYALQTVGGTVVAGAVTTFGSGVLLFAAQMTFFTKMAVLITLTVAFSSAFALLALPAVLAAAGPEGEVGRVAFLSSGGGGSGGVSAASKGEEGEEAA